MLLVSLIIMIAKSKTTKIWATVDTCKPHWHTLEWKFDCFVYWASDRYFEGKKHQMIILSISSLESNVRSSFYYLTWLQLHTYIYIHVFHVMLFELMARASLSITVKQFVLDDFTIHVIHFNKNQKPSSVSDYKKLQCNTAIVISLCRSHCCIHDMEL